jgi:integrase
MSNLTDGTGPEWHAFPGLGPIPFADFAAELMRLYEPPLRALKTRDKMRFLLRIVADLVGPEGSTTDLTPELVAFFIRERPAGESSITTHTLVSYLRTACNYARSRGYVHATPFDFRRKWVSRHIEPRKRHHALEDIARVLATMKAEVGDREGWARWRSRRLHAAACTVAYTGMRAMEAIFLRLDDVILADRMILILPHKARLLKTEGSAQPVPIPPELAEVLEGWMAHRGDPLAALPGPAADCPFLFPNVTFTNAWSGGRQGHKAVDAMKAAGSRAGVEGFTFHSLRHSYATHAESAWGLSPATIQRVLRHTSLSTQTHYRHADAENLLRAVGDVNFGGPAEGDPEE